MRAQPSADLRRLLAQSAIFSTLDPDELDELVALGRSKSVRADQVVFWKGEAAAQLYAVVKGRLKVVVGSADGRDMVLRLLDPGALFAEIGLFDGGARTATVIASEEAELLVVDRRDFMPFLRRRPEAAIKLLAALASRLRATTEQVEDSVFLGVAPRLAKKLLELARSYGRAEGGGTRIAVRLSQQELGDLVATSRVSVNQQLHAWEREGWVRIERGHVTLLDRDRLARLAGEDDEPS